MTNAIAKFAEIMEIELEKIVADESTLHAELQPLTARVASSRVTAAIADEEIADLAQGLRSEDGEPDPMAVVIYWDTTDTKLYQPFQNTLKAIAKAGCPLNLRDNLRVGEGLLARGATAVRGDLADVPEDVTGALVRRIGLDINSIKEGRVKTGTSL